MPREYEDLKNRYEKIRERHYKEIDRARIDGDPEAMVRAAEAMSNSVVNAMLAFEDQNWVPLKTMGVGNGYKGIAHPQLVELVAKAQEMTKMNALMGHALRIKTNHVFGRGFSFDITPAGKSGKTAPRLQKMIDDPENQRVIFSANALKSLNRTLWNTGNIYALWNEREKEFTILPVDTAIEDGVITYDDNPSRVKYYKRSYIKRNDIPVTQDAKNPQNKYEEWIPVLEYKEKLGKSLPKTIKISGKDEPVNQDCVIIDLRVNKDEEDLYGVPDSFAAIPWAWASAEYIKDGSKLLKAYAAIAYQIKTKTESGKKAAGAAIATGKIAGSAVTGPDTEISQINRASAVDLYTGRPIQAMFASAVDLSVTSVTNDTGKGGAYGSEQVLTTPELLSALSRQEDFAAFFSRLFRAMGFEGTLKFKALTVDPDHRRAQTALLFRTGGGISQKEFRAFGLEVLDMEGDPNELPEPDEFTGSKINTLTPDEPEDPNARQGNSGAVGALADGDHELRDEE